MGFIDKKMEDLKESLGFDFMEMARLAKENPEEFLRRKKEIFRIHFPDLADDELETILGKLNLAPAQGDDGPLDTVVANLAESCSLIGRVSNETVSIVSVGAEAVKSGEEVIREYCSDIEKMNKKTQEQIKVTVENLEEIKKDQEKSTQGLESINANVVNISKNFAAQEASQIPIEKKH